MGFLNKLLSQAINVIEWTDDSKDTMVSRFDTQGREIMMGAQLTVRESQVALFVNEGQIADAFQPGRYELKTSNLPVMTKLQSWKFGFDSPFKAEVYFVNTKQFTDCKWGTSNPVMLRDAEFGMIRIRAFGIYSFRVVDPVKFLREAFGTTKMFKTADIEGMLKRTIVGALSDAIGESKIPALDLAANYEELGTYALQVINPKVANLGVALTSFVIENISLPEEVEKSMDRRTSMGVLGDMGKYTQYQTAEAMREAAQNPNGAAGAGMGLGAGIAVAQTMANSLNQSAAPQKASGAFCHNCGKPIPQDSKFCPECGARQSSANVCPGCGAQVQPGSKFCPGCGAKL